MKLFAKTTHAFIATADAIDKAILSPDYEVAKLA
jgi:hypothetical protein